MNPGIKKDNDISTPTENRRSVKSQDRVLALMYLVELTAQDGSTNGELGTTKL